MFIWSFLLQKCKQVHAGQSILQVLLPCLKRNDSQTFKCRTCKNIFLQCVSYWSNFFLTNVLNVFPKLVTLKFFFNHHVLAVFEISVLKAVRILHNLHSNTNTKVKKISVSLSPAPFRGHIFHMRDNPYDLCFLQMLTKTKTTTSCNHFRRLFKSIWFHRSIKNGANTRGIRYP